MTYKVNITKSCDVSIELDFEDIADEILEFIRDKYFPEDVFFTDDLDSWAEQAGYIQA